MNNISHHTFIFLREKEREKGYFFIARTVMATTPSVIIVQSINESLVWSLVITASSCLRLTSNGVSFMAHTLFIAKKFVIYNDGC